MGANTSIYTKYSVMPTLMHDFPFTETLSRENQLDIALEVILWGGSGFVIELMAHMGLLAFVIGQIPNDELNEVEIYTVDPAFYTAASFI